VQLVVVGDQSSGKSSLLEGLTGLSFPIASDLCTRFATQIVLRRAPAEDAEVRVTIIPGPSAQADEEIKERLIRFERKLSTDEFDSEEFHKVFDEVCSDRYLGVEVLTGSRLQNAWVYQVRAPKSLKTSKSGSPMISSKSSCLGLNTTTSVSSMSQGCSTVSKDITMTPSFLIS
jgi:GTPase SAR1 family protein